MSNIPSFTQEAGFTNLRDLLDQEFTQSKQEGKDLEALEKLRVEFDSMPDDASVLSDLHEKLLDLPQRADFFFEEPSNLEGIRNLRSAPVSLPAPSFDQEELYQRLYGAWLGRCSGCALGKPPESMGAKYGDLESWQRQKEYLIAVSPGEWPLRDYFPGASPAVEKTGKVGSPKSTREHIDCMESDDDIRYTVLGQKILLEKGVAFSTTDVARVWLQELPYYLVCTAETQVYRNLVTLGAYHLHKASSEKIDWNWVVTHQNPFREWIGAQIRIDSYGYAAPGNPELAAELAWRDARLSHVKNGIYGAMFCAAMISAAFVTTDPRLIIEAGLAQIPQTSRLHADILATMAICDKHDYDFGAFETVIEEIYALLGHYHYVHTNNNAAICAAALLLSGGDFHKAITFAVMGGWDTDCNGATVGSIVGAIAGAQNIPSLWKDPLNDTLNSLISGYHPIAISECAQRSLDIALKVQSIEAIPV